MRGRSVQPIAELDRRIPRAGKVKLGAKTAKAMTKLEAFRFLSPFKDCIEAIAAQYGGECKPYHDDDANPKDQFEVFTTASSIEVYLIPDGIDACYEMWGGGMRQRNCDGRICSIEEPDHDDYIIVEHKCLCMAEGTMRCKPKLRIVVLMPNVPMRGAWLLETGSWFAQNEMPGMFDLITTLSRDGMKRATLSIDRRTDVKFGRNGKPIRRNYVVPVLSMVDTPMEIMGGMADVRAISAGAGGNLPSQGVATPSLGPGTPVAVRGPGAQAEGFSTLIDDDVVEAEIVDEELDLIEEGLRSDAAQFGLDEDRFVAAMLALGRMLVKGEEPTRLQVFDRLRKARMQMASGEREPIGLTADGQITWSKK